MTDKQIEQIIHSEYRDYAHYVLHSRAIPSVIDGLKPGQRKALYTAIRKAKSPVKTMSLIGSTISFANFHHGDASLESAINLMAAPWNNNVPLLKGIGSFGSKVKPDAAAARYTSVQLSPNFDKWFRDNDILESNEDPENPEPKFYLPLIPWVLVNGVRGIAVGFATEIQPRDPEELAKACKKYIETGKLPKEIPPYYDNFRGTIEKSPQAGNWQCTGVFEWLSATEIEISEIPVGISRDRYVELLNKLEDNDERVKSYSDYCDKSGFRFRVKFKRAHGLTDAQVIKLLGLRASLNENITVIDDINNCVRIFDNEVELLQYFCDYRLKTMQTRLNHYIDRDTEALRYHEVRLEFVKAVVDGDLSFKGKNQKMLRAWITNNILNSTPDDEEKLIRIPAYAFCSDEIKRLQEKIKELKKAIKYWKTATPEQVYSEDLSELV